MLKREDNELSFGNVDRDVLLEHSSGDTEWTLGCTVWGPGWRAVWAVNTDGGLSSEGRSHSFQNSPRKSTRDKTNPSKRILRKEAEKLQGR